MGYISIPESTILDDRNCKREEQRALYTILANSKEIPRATEKCLLLGKPRGWIRQIRVRTA